MPDIEKLPKDVQRKIAPIRQKYQPEGFRHMLKNPDVVHRMAIGIAHQLVDKSKLLDRYAVTREVKNEPLERDAVINIATHGMFMESLLREAGIYVAPDGKETQGITDFENPEFGGYIQPVESISLDIDDPHHLPERIPVSFEGEHRPQGKVFIDREKLLALNQDYKRWKGSTETEQAGNE